MTDAKTTVNLLVDAVKNQLDPNYAAAIADYAIRHPDSDATLEGAAETLRNRWAILGPSPQAAAAIQRAQNGGRGGGRGRGNG